MGSHSALGEQDAILSYRPWRGYWNHAVFPWSLLLVGVYGDVKAYLSTYGSEPLFIFVSIWHPWTALGSVRRTKGAQTANARRC